MVVDVAAEESHLVGHSMGGYLVAMILAADGALAIASGVAISAGPTSDPTRYPALKTTTPQPSTWERLIENAPTGNFETDLTGWLESWRFLNGDRPFDLKLATTYTREIYTGDPRNSQVAKNHVYAMSTVPTNLPEQLKKVSVPLRVAHGPKDPLVPVDNGEALRRLTPDSSFHPLEGAGHMFFADSTWDELREVIVSSIRDGGR